MDYWIQSLAGRPPALELPGGSKRSAVSGYSRAEHPLTVPAEGGEYTLACTAALLKRLCGQDDLVIGVAGSSGIVPIRCDLSGQPSLQSLQADLEESVRDACDQAGAGLDEILSALGVQHAQDLFQVMVVLEPANLRQAEGASVDMVFDVSSDVPRLIYNGAIFSPSFAERMAGHFATLQASMLAQPLSAIADLDLLTPEERSQILVQWNDKVVEFPDEATLHGLFEGSARTHPESVAVTFRSNSLSYGELDRASNQLARHLISLGVGPEVMVGISAERSLELVIGLVALAKAGGAYMPMDPAYPHERLQYMLEDSGVEVVLTQAHLVEGLPKGGARIVCLDDAAVYNALDESPVEGGADAQSLAYVIYTSGSTGAPKGVMLNHQGRVNNFLDFNRRFDVAPGDALIALASLSFDMCAYDVFGILAAGATVVMPDPSGLQDPGHWASQMNAHKVSIWHTAPAMLKMLVDYLEVNPDRAPASLRLVLLGGDWIPVSLPDRLRALVSGVRVISMGGATECSMDSTIFEVHDVDPEWTSIPYGEPMANQRAYVLDGNLEPLPIGAPGELYLGGIGVGRGYFQRPDLTRERFLDDPFLEGDEHRMYRTGDLARWMGDGNLELIGRVDNQVKIRGYRIELGEIEARINAHPAVREGVVVTREDSTGEKVLVAYMVQDPEWSGPEEESNDLGAEQVEQWEAVYDHAYTAQANVELEDPTFNIISWDSSYTGTALPPEQMRNWVDQTVARIRRHNPRRVLEIGCGMGLLLFRIAPHCERYVGTDFSKVALDYVARYREPLGLPQVELARRWADDFEGVEPGSLDCVVLNSIILDFPSMDYLMDVIAGSIAALASGGTLFLGDVRGLPLLNAYQSSVQLFQAPDDLGREQIEARVRRLVRHEEELVIDPTFFAWLQTRFPQITRVQIQLKRGDFTNELNAFRYDVTLYVGEGRGQVSGAGQDTARWVDWPSSGLDLAGLRRQIEEDPRQLLCLRAIPNVRVLEALRCAQMLGSSEGPADAGSMRAALAEAHENAPGWNPEDFWALGEELGIETDVRFSSDLASGHFDVVFGPAGQSAVFPDETGLEVDPGREARDFANNPMLGKLARKIGPALRRTLAEQLPEYMVPPLYVPLDELPLSPNGKVDRKRLPEPDTSRPEVETDYAAPQTALQRTVAGIWVDVLSFDRVGVRDTFFDLGGHSLLAVLIQTRLNEILPFTLTLGDIFQFPTVEQLSERITSLGVENGVDAEEVCIMLESIGDLTDEEVAALMEEDAAP